MVLKEQDYDATCCNAMSLLSLQDLREWNDDRLLGAPLAWRSNLVGKQSLLQVEELFRVPLLFKAELKRSIKIRSH